jgi:hypothetical protein
MDDTTFGSSQSAIDLVKELKDNHPFLIRRVSRFIQVYRDGFESIKEIQDRRHQIRIATMWRKEFIEKVNFHPDIDSFVKNLLVASYRNFLRETQ